ncbi:uncharacterized protein LOC141911309 [Tubulanus polymorphus]|uniref:uncharacterized protein LOC141911309 n=1 Tax=Tubulanus polymorphus TaxID=672921 RepID=UPI003DA4054D
MSELECLKSCANFAKFLCRSADYQTGRRECWIQSESRFTFPEKYRNFTDYKMIDWQCEAINSLYFQGVQGRQIPSPDVAAVGPMTSGSELECALACLANQRCDLIVFKLISSSKGNCRLYNSIMVPDTKWQPPTDELVFKDESRINF